MRKIAWDNKDTPRHDTNTHTEIRSMHKATSEYKL